MDERIFLFVSAGFFAMKISELEGGHVFLRCAVYFSLLFGLTAVFTALQKL